MQAIARVSRALRDKPGGLIVELLGIAEPLKEAMAGYTATRRPGRPTLNQDEAVDEFRRRQEIVRQFFHGFDAFGYSTADDNRRLRHLSPRWSLYWPRRTVRSDSIWS
jgi:type I restriction enzyme R subunit